ncbi:hypothetical protein [Iodobacter fluviatilis]|uniref:Uncharacterized protein n=1 Tax=Iodobacter fluviatilis TaxID=537 RepID=A0A7G3GAP8_9NEIS|nr:hypothetical protein [Iodobacter fluviatilis]QBC44316.1 hypothetical protein C1H71_12785 [Iodobacter fluviatilis]
MNKNKKNICLYLTSAITMIAAVLFMEPAFAGPLMQTRPAVPDLSHPLRPALPDLAVPLQPNKPHTRPLPIKQVFRMEQGVLLIEDQVANTQYITTLDSRGSMELGSPAAAIFGARIPRQGAKKPAVWYTHKTDPQVKQIHLLKPREAFQGMADEYGNAVALSSDRFEVQNGRQLNPVLSPAAFDGLAKMSAGASRQLSLTEILADGRERERINTVYKRGQLTLGAAPAQSCRNEVLDGVAGKLCVLRTIQGQHQATTGGDIKFTIRSRIATPNARFRVGANWHRLGESVPLAEFANSKQIEVFFVPPAPVEGAVAMPLLNLDRVVEAGFYSSSRLSRGDRFNLQISNRPITDGTHSVMSRLGLLLIDDQPSGRQYITTLSGTASQAVFGERRAQGGTRPVIWYAENSRFKSLFPLLSIVNLQPPQYFAGVANEQGQISVGRMGALPGYVNPAFNEQAFADFVGMPVGKQQLLSFDGQRSGGDKSRFQLNLSKAAQLILSADGTCRAEAVEGVAGQVCVLRRVGGESKANTAGEVRFRVSAHLRAAEQAQSRYRVSHVWHKLGEPVGLTEFGQSKAIELFIPDTEAGDNKATFNTINGEFYAPGRSHDRFVIGMSVKKFKNSTKLPIRPKGGRTDYAPHIIDYNGGGIYPAPETLSLGALPVGQRFNLKTYPETGWKSGFEKSGQPSVWAPQGSPFTCGTSKPLAPNSDGTIPSGNKDFVFKFYSSGNFIPCNGSRPFFTAQSDGQTAMFYFSAGRFQIMIERVGSSGDQTMITYPTIIPRVDPTDAGVFDFVGPNENQPNVHPGFYPDRDQGYPFPPTPAKVASLTATPNPVVEGSTTKVTVKLDKAALAGQKVYVKFAAGTADITDLANQGMLNLVGATGAVSNLGTGGAVTVTTGATEFTFDISTANDADEGTQSFEVRAKEGQADVATAPKVKIDIEAIATPAVVSTLEATPNPVVEGSTTKVKVKLDRAALAGQQVYVKFAAGTADITDLANQGMLNLVGATGAVSNLDTGGAVTVTTGATEFTFDISTANDADEGTQSFEVRGKEGNTDVSTAPKVIIEITPKVEALKVESVVASPKTVLAGGKVRFTVTLNKPIARSRANQAVFVRFAGVGGSPAGIDDLVTPSMLNLQGASGPVSDLSVGAAVAVPTGGKVFTFDVQTKADAELFDEQFEIRANIGTSEVGLTQAKDSVTIEPAPVSPTIEFSSVATEQAGVFKVGAPAVDMSYGVKIRNVVIIRKNKDIPASKVAAYLKQRIQRAFAASIKLDSMGTANVGGAQYCTFTSDRGNKLIPLPVSMIYNAADTPLDCNGANGISLGYPGVTGDWSAQDATTYIARVGMKFTMGDPVSQKTSTGGYWYGIARSKGKLVLSLNTGP